MRVLAAGAGRVLRVRHGRVARLTSLTGLTTGTVCSPLRVAPTRRPSARFMHTETSGSGDVRPTPPLLDSQPAADTLHQTARTPQERYRQLVKSGVLRDDAHQRRVIDKLQATHDQLLEYNPPPVYPDMPPSSFWYRLFTNSLAEPKTAPPSFKPQNLYLFGDVGTGKSMLMDLFYDTLPADLKRKRRVHFHAFMIDVHKRVHAAKASGVGGDPILPVAKELAEQAYVLCFDEFQVTDIADAMILRRLMECLLNFGVTFVMTSNRHPDELYKNGIQRASFVPCIDLLKTKFDLVNLDSGTDYRRIPRALSNVYFHPLSSDNLQEVDKIFDALAKNDNEAIRHDRKLDIWGRKLHVPVSTSSVAKFTFDELCGSPLSAADYIELTKTFPTIFVTHVPKMSMEQKDKARRFITFIDACYESKTKLFVTSEVPIFQVFSDASHAANKDVSDHMRSVMDDLGLSSADIGASSMFTGEEEVFAFARCCSRLIQMGTKEWAETAGAH